MAVSTIDPNGLNIGQIGGRRNKISNPEFKIAQRGTSFSGLGNNDTQYTLDRWRFSEGGDPTCDITVSQSTDAPDGFGYSLKYNVTYADASLGASDQIKCEQFTEAQNEQDLAYGTSSAKTMVLSFYVKSNQTGTYAFWIYQNDDARQQTHNYTIDAADTWERKSIVIVGDSTGVIDNDNNRGFLLSWCLSAGSNYTSGTASSTWEASNDANRFAGQTVNLIDTTNNYWQITGVQLEVGDVATPFEHRSYGEELSACQRYYQQWNAVEVMGAGIWYTANQVLGHMPFKQTMRTSPTITVSAADFCKVYKISATVKSNDSGSPFDIINLSNARINIGMVSSGTAGQGALIQTETGAAIYVDAEL